MQPADASARWVSSGGNYPKGFGDDPGMSRPALFLLAVLLLSTGCGGDPDPTTPTATTTIPPRLDYATACPELIQHGQAGVDLITEFLADPQAMANSKTQTAARFDTVIDRLNRDAIMGPPDSVGLLAIQMSQLRELRDFAMIGGTLQVDLNEFKQATGQIVVKCGGTLPTTTPPAPTTTAPADTIGQGTHVVGTDIQPGTYKTTGPAGSSPCYWARLSDTSGEGDAIIANDLSDGPSTVTIKKTDGAFETSRCSLWTKVS